MSVSFNSKEIQLRSYWASENPHKARMLLVLFNIALLTNTILLSALLDMAVLVLPLQLGFFCFVGVAVCFLEESTCKSYVHHKRLAAVHLFLSLLLLLITIGSSDALSVTGNTLPKDSRFSLAAIGISAEISNTGTSYLLPNQSEGFIQRSVRNVKRKISKKLRKLIIRHGSAPSNKFVYFLKISFAICFTVAVSMLLGLLTLLYSCSLTCNGASNAATAVFFVGSGLTGLVVAFSILWINRITENRRLELAAAKNAGN